MDALKLVWVAQVAIKPLNSIVLCVTITNTWAKCRGWLQSGLWTHLSGIQIEIPMMVDLWKHYSHSDKIIIIIINNNNEKTSFNTWAVFKLWGTDYKHQVELIPPYSEVVGVKRHFYVTLRSFMVSPREHINMVITLTAEWQSSFSESCEQVFKGHHY